MARAGVFNICDIIYSWHPGGANGIMTGSYQANCQVYFKFHGTTAHAAGSPHLGRSALDAVELMNVGVQYLREHTKDDARIHYAIIDGGGVSPNVVQPTASVLYMVRSKLVRDALILQERVDKIAEGAAMMTETSFERIFIDGCSGTVPNHTLEKLLYDNLLETELPVYTSEEVNYAEAIKATYKTFGRLPTLAAEYDKEAKEEVAKLTKGGALAINNFVAPLYTGDAFSPGSTDVGDVSWQTPTAQVYTAAFTSLAPGHSWQNVSLSKSSIGHKGMLLAGKVIAGAVIDLFEDSELLSLARNEFLSITKGEYISPIPDGEYPKTIEM
jgi:aminobenzoyl-glutamate utilization protein B